MVAKSIFADSHLYSHLLLSKWPGRVAQSVGHLTRKSGVLGSIPGLATYFRFSFRFFKKGSCQLLAKVCANRLGGLSLPRKSVVRLTDRPDMTLDVYRGRKTTIQLQQSIQMRSCLYVKTQLRIEILSNWQNFDTLLRICMLAVCKLDKISIFNAYKHEATPMLSVSSSGSCHCTMIILCNRCLELPANIVRCYWVLLRDVQ